MSLSSRKKFGTYVASRDIPLACRELQTTSPSKIVGWIKNNRWERDKKTKKRIQKVLRPEAITMYFNRHPKVKQQLLEELGQEEISNEGVSETLFENGVFQKEVESIRSWIRDMTLRGAKKGTIRNFVSWIKRACLGKVGKGQVLENWGIKHPDELTLDNAKDFLFELKERGMHARNCALAFRNYFRSRGMPETLVRQISGAIEEKGKYAHLKTTDSKMHAILDHVTYRNLQAGLMAEFAYVTGARMGGALSADYGNVDPEDKTIIIMEKASKGKKKRLMKKAIPSRLWKKLGFDDLDGKSGKVFNVTPNEVNKLLNEAYQLIIPELASKIPMPFHFLRHQFAQTMLKKLKRNYSVVAKLGGWKTQTLEDYYGALDIYEARELAQEALESL